MKDKSQYNIPASTLIGAVGHHSYFLTNSSAQNRIYIHANRIFSFGLSQYLNDEYLATAQGGTLNKNFIINEIDGRYFLLDGNLHMLSIILAMPTITLGEIIKSANQPNIIRFWKNGYENHLSTQKEPYDTYVPLNICTDRIIGAYEGTDYFKQPPESIFIIPSNIPYDSVLFHPAQRGQPLWKTASVLIDKHREQYNLKVE